MVVVMKDLFGFAVWGLIPLLAAVPTGVADVVINELHYNPVDDGFEAGSLREFIELHNPGPATIDVSGYTFTKGIGYTFPEGITLDSGGYLVLARVPTHRTWRGKPYQVFGPYDGKLSNSGEQLTLKRPDGSLVERMEYDDEAPWPRGADGYGGTLERVQWELPAADYHSWRASLREDGTPGAANSIISVVPRPMIVGYTIEPEHPTSTDPVTVSIGFDSPDGVASATLRWEIAGRTGVRSESMQRLAGTIRSVTYVATIPPASSQTLIRFNAEVELPDGGSVRLPHEAEPRPFESYFVYDGEVESLLPVLWMLQPSSTRLPTSSLRVSGAVTRLPGEAVPSVFDGARVISSRNGLKIRFLKGEEFRGDRTINIIPEEPAWGTKPGASAPFREHLSFWFFEEMGVLSPRAEFFRVITLPVTGVAAQSQRLVIQQVNERFLEMNGRSSDGDLYKLERFDPNWEKHTNKEDGIVSIRALLASIRVTDPIERRTAMELNLAVDEFVAFSAASVLSSNWDGFWQNHWMYLNPEVGGRWEIFPWDLDWLWGSTSNRSMYAEMPTTFPFDGVATGAPHASRPPGPVTAQIHKDDAFHEEYLLRMRADLDRAFSQENLFAKIDELQTLLQDDLELLERQVGFQRPGRFTAIRQSYRDIRSFIEARRTYLDGVLPVPVTEWELY